MNADERRVHVEGLPPKGARPICEHCGKPLAYWTKDTREGGGISGRIIRREFERFRGYPRGAATPFFCRLRCALEFATNVVRQRRAGRV